MPPEAAFRWEAKQSSNGHHPWFMGILSAPFPPMELFFHLAAKAWQSLLPAVWVRGKQTWQEWLQQWNSTDNCAQGTRNCLISQQRCTQSVTECCAEGSLLRARRGNAVPQLWGSCRDSADSCQLLRVALFAQKPALCMGYIWLWCLPPGIKLHQQNGHCGCSYVKIEVMYIRVKKFLSLVYLSKLDWQNHHILQSTVMLLQSSRSKSAWTRLKLHRLMQCVG